MRVAIGAVTGTLGGPATYAVELVRALVRKRPEDEYVVLTDAPARFRDVAECVAVGLSSSWQQPLWDHVRIPAALAGGGFDLYHGTKGVLPRVLRIPAVVTVHDLAVRVLPHTFRFAQRVHLGLETGSSLRRARRVITDSHSSAVDLERFYGAQVAGKLAVVPLGAPSAVGGPASAEAVERWRRAHGVSGVCVGYLGTLQPRKNLDVLADAFREAAGDEPWTLLVAGRLRPGYRPRFLDSGDPRIVYLGVLPDDELAAFFGSLTVMVSPSSYEGFGLSFLEAMSAGAAVVGVRNSSVPEVVGDAGVLVEEADVALLAAAIRRVVTDRAFAETLRSRALQRAQTFSWERTAERTAEVYAEALASSTPAAGEEASRRPAAPAQAR